MLTSLKSKFVIRALLRRALRSCGVLLLFALFLAFSAPAITYFSSGSEVAFAADKKDSKKKSHKKKRRRRSKEGKKEGKDKGKRDSSEEGGGVELTPDIDIDGELRDSQFDSALGQSGAIDAVLILDASRSMQRTDPERLRDQGAKLFLRFLSETDRISVIQFDQDTKILVPLTAVSPEVLSDIDKAIESVSVEGNFTDLWSPIVAALEILGQEGRIAAQKSVILLSDGKMDPHPNIGSSRELIQRLRETDLPQYREKEIKLYTLALSEEADRTLLGEMARETDGLYWYAPSVNAVHKIFSDLFLTLKKPQVVALEGAGFEVDGTTTEATFYISRKNADQIITIVDPRGKRFTNVEFPTNIKWFRGDLFDVVTIKQPFPGPWGIEGMETPEGFVTLLTDLKLQVSWPGSNLRVGESARFKARLTENDEVVNKPGMKEITFFSYKIVNNRTGQLILQGGMNDEGKDGDKKAGDNHYSAVMKIDEEGEYKALISVTSPTFVRQQHRSFNVSRGMVNLVKTGGNEFTGEEEGLRVVLSSRALELKKIKIRLAAQKVGEDTPVGYPLQKYETERGVFDIPMFLLEEGEYKLFATLEGFDSKKKKVESRSETIDFVSKGGGDYEEDVEGVEIEDHEEEDPAAVARMWGLISLLTSLVWAGGVGFFVFKRADTDGGVSVEERIPWTIPEEVQESIDELRERASDEHRPPTEEEVELFAAVAGSLGSVAEKTEEEGENDAESEEGAAEQDDEGEDISDDSASEDEESIEEGEGSEEDDDEEDPLEG